MARTKKQDAVKEQGQVTLGPVRSITIPMPEGCETVVKLLMAMDSKKSWWTGFEVSRAYEVGTADCANMREEPDMATQDFGLGTICSACDDASDRATSFLRDNSASDDEKAYAAIEAVDQWYKELEDGAGEEIFDHEQPAEAETVEEPSAEESHVKRMADLDKEIVALCIEQANLSVRLKVAKKHLDIAVEERAHLEARGPEEMPLFDKVKELDSDKTESDGEPADDGEWRGESLANVNGLTPKLLEILESHDIRTMGDLADAPKVKGCELTQLKGITEARFQQIQEASENFFAARQA